jgi:hypothetical protein
MKGSLIIFMPCLDFTFPDAGTIPVDIACCCWRPTNKRSRRRSLFVKHRLPSAGGDDALRINPG